MGYYIHVYFNWFLIKNDVEFEDIMFSVMVSITMIILMILHEFKIVKFIISNFFNK